MSTNSAVQLSEKQSPEGPSNELREAEGEVIALFIDLAVIFGLPRSYGEIYGLLYVSAQPLSFTDIHERLELSKGSVSMGLKALRGIGAIRPAEGPDWRREHFVPVTELRTLIAGFLKGSIEPQLKQGQARLGALKAKHRGLLESANGEGHLLGGRIEKLDTWHRKGGTLLPLISKFLG